MDNLTKKVSLNFLLIISGTTIKGHKKKPDEAFTDHLKQMKRNYPGSNMNV